MKLTIKPHWVDKGGKVSAFGSVLGSWQICHSTCMSIIGALSLFGIAVSGMPLLFLNTWQLPIWIGAAALFGLLLLLRFGFKFKCISNISVAGTTGLLLAGVPFPFVSQNFKMIGFIITTVALLWYISRLIIIRNGQQITIDMVSQGRRVAGGLMGLILIITLSIFNSRVLPTASTAMANSATAPSHGTMMKFTLFDAAEAKQLMDKDGDGKCDVCGMDIDQCIGSGMMQCTMDKNATIGLLGSQHIHAQFELFQNGKSVDLTSYGHRMDGADDGLSSSFMHVHSDDGAKKLHMHATGVPLSLFFKSIKMDLDPKKVSATVNGKAIESPLEYVFKDGDTIEMRIE